jgi:DNA polymerase III epsilon subunit-like protein
MYEQNVIDLKKSWYILSFAYKWQGEKKVTTKALPDYKRFRKDIEDDRDLVRDLHALFDEANIIIGHNGDKFDIKKSNARFIKHGLRPPSPYKTVDTLKIARSKFAFVSNRLNDLGAYLGLGRKLPHTGFHLWKRCMLGDRKAYGHMRRYNARDVVLLERVWKKLAPWLPNHPALHSENCPVCKSHKVQRRGPANVKAKKPSRFRFECRSCGHWFSR